MSLRSLVAAAKDGYTLARPTPDGETAVSSGGRGDGSVGTHKAVQWSSDQWWEAMGGPYCAAYHHFASLTAIGVAEGEPYRVHFMDPADALEHFRALPDRYRTDATLRGSCKIIYKDHWYMVEPYADDADHAVKVMRDEVNRDRRSGAAT